MKELLMLPKQEHGKRLYFCTIKPTALNRLSTMVKQNISVMCSGAETIPAISSKIIIDVPSLLMI